MIQLRRLKPSQAHLRVATLAILIVMCTLLILSAVFPFPEATISSLLSIGLGTGRYASAQPVSTNGMAYAQVNKSGCCVRKGNCQIRLDFYLEPEDVRYYDKYLYLVDTDSPEYLAGYPGKVDEFGNPIDQAEWDKWWDSLPRVWVNTPFHTHFIYLSPDFTEEDIKAQIDIHLGNFYQAFQDGWDAVQGGMRHGWATETRIRPTDWAKVESPAEYDARIAACESAVDSLTEFSYKPDGEIQGETFPSTEIDIGSAATDRSSAASIDGYTGIYTENPANGSGVLDEFEVYMVSASSGAKIGTFSGSGDTWTSRDYESVGAITAGSKQTFSGLDCDVETDDIIGIYSIPSGTPQVEYDLSGTGTWIVEYGDKFGAGETVFNDWSDTSCFVSLYGTGDTAGGEPSIANTPSSNAFGVLEVGSQATTGFEYFTITNNGTVAVDVTIQGTNATGGDDVWVLSDTATQGENQFGMIASTDSEALYEYYDTGNDGAGEIWDYNWRGQTFTPSSNHTITGVSLLLTKTGSPGTITVSIQGTDGSSHPDGTNLCSGTTDGDTISGMEWRTITLGTVANLIASTKYAIVVSARDGDYSNYIEWQHDSSSPTYAGGASEASSDSGGSWSTLSGTDNMFREYGGDFDVIVKQAPTYNTLLSNLAINATQDWGLLLLMPTSLSGYDMGQMTATITLVASEAS